MTTLEDRLRVSHQFAKFARDNKCELSPSKFLAYLDIKGYLNVDFMIQDSKRIEEQGKQESEQEEQ